MTVTLGPTGRNVLIDQGFGPPRFTKDGFTVAREVELPDPTDNIGARLVRETASRTNDLAGDGTTTAVVLTRCMVREGRKAVAAGLSPIEIRRGMDAAVAALVAELRDRSRATATEAEIAQVGTVSANGDAVIGASISDAMKKVGRDGVITVEVSQSVETEIDFVGGMRFDRGYLSSHFATDTAKMETELTDVSILIVDGKLSALKPLLPLLEAVIQAERSLLIVAEDVEGDALTTLVVNKLRGALRVAAVKSPGYGAPRQSMLEDLAILTGCEIVSDQTGLSVETTTLDRLGRARRVVVGRDSTTIIEGQGEPALISARCAEIRNELEDAEQDHDRGRLQDRLAKLTGGVAVVRVGGTSEADTKERKDRFDDALHATRAAIAEGIVPGGGVALARASEILRRLNVANEAQRLGVEIVRRAAQEPLRRIVENAGEDGAVVAWRVLASPDPGIGFDVRTRSYVDMIDAGIIDPTKVVRSALENAASIAGLLVTAEVSICDEVEEPIG